MTVNMLKHCWCSKCLFFISFYFIHRNQKIKKVFLEKCFVLGFIRSLASIFIYSNFFEARNALMIITMDRNCRWALHSLKIWQFVFLCIPGCNLSKGRGVIISFNPAYFKQGFVILLWYPIIISSNPFPFRIFLP